MEAGRRLGGIFARPPSFGPPPLLPPTLRICYHIFTVPSFLEWKLHPCSPRARDLRFGLRFVR